MNREQESDTNSVVKAEGGPTGSAFFVIRPAQQDKTTSAVPATANTCPNAKPEVYDVQLPVSYKSGGKTVKASATRLSPKGCLVLTKKPHRV